MSTIGLIANPVSARDIRRIVANASNLQIADRVNIVMRVLTAAHSLGVERVLVMPDNGGIRALLQRHLSRGHSQHQRWPVVEYLDMEPREYFDGRALSEGLLNHIEVAIRAYDPCLSCATHALGRMPLALTLLGPEGALRERVLRHGDGRCERCLS